LPSAPSDETRYPSFVRGALARFGAVCAGIALVWACATSSTSQPPTSTDAGGDDAGDDGAQSEGGPGGDGNLLGDQMNPPQMLGCSADLQNVVDGSGKVVQACPPDQGCAGGQCIAACAAAGQSHGNVACDFVVATPSFFDDDAPPCFAVFLANNWPHDAKITVSYAGTKYDATKFGRIPDGTPNAAGWAPVPATGVPTNKVAVLFLSHDPTSTNFTPLTCPIPPAISQPGGTAVWAGSGVAAASGRGKAWHLATDIPVSAYDMLPYGGAKSYLPSAELILPTTAWGTNYVAAIPQPTLGPGWGQVVASVDNTTVKIVPTTSLPGGPNVAAAPKNMVTTYTLAAGEYIQWQDSGDMSGSILSASQPIAFTGGSGYLFLGGAGDSAHQMVPPVSALGSAYVASPFATRRMDLQEESIPYRLVGAVDGTTLTYDPPQASAPATLSSGQVVDFTTTGPFTITSQDAKHPFYVGQHMQGSSSVPSARPFCSDTMGNPSCYLGDEEFMNVLPPAQWLQKYVFFTDPTYPTTNLVLVREKTATGFSDVTVDCVGKVGGWKPVGGSGKYEITNVDLIRGMPNGSCTNGGHVASSGGPFGLVVWGLDFCSSYAYPAGGNVAVINQVVVPPTPK
jgi:hypothetical protein